MNVPIITKFSKSLFYFFKKKKYWNKRTKTINRLEVLVYANNR